MKPAFLVMFFSVAIYFGVTVNTSAQTTNNFQEDETTLPPNRANILQSLGLSRQQFDRIRTINQQYRPPLRQSNQRMQAANQALDEAVYGGEATEATIQTRLREAQTAHSEWLSNRTKLEGEISKVLTPGQLTRFRQFRLQNKKINMRNRQINNQTQPVPRLNRIQRQMRNRRLQQRINL